MLPHDAHSLSYWHCSVFLMKSFQSQKKWTCTACVCTVNLISLALEKRKNFVVFLLEEKNLKITSNNTLKYRNAVILKAIEMCCSIYIISKFCTLLTSRLGLCRWVFEMVIVIDYEILMLVFVKILVMNIGRQLTQWSTWDMTYISLKYAFTSVSKYKCISITPPTVINILCLQCLGHHYSHLSVCLGLWRPVWMHMHFYPCVSA